MKKLVLIVLLAVSLSAFAQEEQFAQSFFKEKIENMSHGQQDSLEIIMNVLETSFRKQQVKSIGGIDFGISREEALIKLRNKYGSPVYNPERTYLTFENVKYAGHDFSSAVFLFDSDGTKSYLSTCIFVNKAKTRSEALTIMEGLKKDLEIRYVISSFDGENGFPVYYGGVSPFWDGNLANLKDEDFIAWHMDVFEYDQDLVKVFGNKYGVRLVYGPYNYVKEEF